MQNTGLHCACRSKQFSHARDLYLKCLKQRPNDIAILSNIAAVYIKLEDFSKALAHARHVLQLEPLHPKCLYRCGISSMKLAKYTEAVHLLVEVTLDVVTFSYSNNQWGYQALHFDCNDTFQE